MTRILKTSGFLGLAVQMVWGMANVGMHIAGTPPYFAEIVGAHAHFGVLGILAVVTGFAVDRFEVSGTRRTIAVWGFVVGQWLLPATLVVQGATGLNQLGMLMFVWGVLLLASMAVMTQAAWNDSGGAAGL